MLDVEERKKKLRKDSLILVIVGVVYYFIFTLTGHGLPCIIRLITGYQCPGCGMTRAVAALVRGDFQTAFYENHLSVTLFPVVLLYLLFRCYRYIKGAESYFAWWEIVFLTVSFIICIGYGVWRNPELFGKITAFRNYIFNL